MTVTSPKGFRAAGVAAGLKTTGKPDVAVVVNDGPSAAAAGVFTGNRVAAAPVHHSRRVLAGGAVRAVVLNSGGANACTGERGAADTAATAAHLAKALTEAGVAGAGLTGAGLTEAAMSGSGAGTATGTGLTPVDAAEIAVCSTGLIGEYLPMPKLLAGVGAAVAELSPTGGAAAAEAIMTTDTRPKTAAVTTGGFTVGGMAKGAGMLAPGLATMLVVVTTDAVAEPAQLNTALRTATALTFDRVDSDGCMSTNDTVLLLASGASGVTPSQQELTDAVTEVCASLAAALVADAEGATKEIAIEVRGAASEADAMAAGRAVARSNLVKCAFFGNDPNWGRILSAVGTTSAVFDPEEIDVAINTVTVCRSGTIGDDRSGVDLSGRNIAVTVDLHAGDASATIWTNDLSLGYVHENSAYSS